MRRRCQRNSVSGVTSHPARLGRGSSAAIAPSKLRSASVISGRSTWRRSTPSWWRNTMISRSFERPDRTVSRASDATNRYKNRYTTNQHRPTSRQVNNHGRVSGTHRSQSAASSASPQARTARFTVCQSQLNSAATSATGRASRPTAIVAQRPARVVSADLLGAIWSSTSVNEPTPHPAAGQRQRHLCHMGRTGRPNAGRSTKVTGAGALGPHRPAAAPTGRPASSPDV